MEKIMENSKIRKVLKEQGFIESNFDEFEQDEKTFNNRNFKSKQFMACMYNFNNSLDDLCKTKKFYIVRLSKKQNDVRIWSYQ